METSTAPKLSKWREALWPIHRFELKRFVPLLIIYSLICFNYSILRATKDALVITAPSSGAEAIPFIKVWAILPMAVLFTFFFTRLSARFNIKKIFYIMVGVFLLFFLVFSFFLYPNRDLLHPHALSDQLQDLLPTGFQGLITIFRNWTFTLFYVMSELWGTMIMTVLFWGFANEITSVGAAKRYYAILGLGANVASVLSGQLSVFLSQDLLEFSLFASQDSWGRCLNFITISVILVGLGIIYTFRWYTKHVLKTKDLSSPIQADFNKKAGFKMSMRTTFAYLAKSKYLLCIAVIVLAYNVAMNMVEVVWKDQIRQLYPEPAAFNAYMGNVMTAMGLISTFISLFLCGNLIRRFGWTFSAMITPVAVLISGVLFFAAVFFKDSAFSTNMAIALGVTPIAITVFLGSLQNCLSRACKYTLFDATKELAFIPLSYESKLKGKAAIDGVGSRLGKSGGSFLHQMLLIVFGSISMSTPIISVFLLIIIGAFIGATRSLGKQFHDLTTPQQPQRPEPPAAPLSPEPT